MSVRLSSSYEIFSFFQIRSVRYAASAYPRLQHFSWVTTCFERLSTSGWVGTRLCAHRISASWTVSSLVDFHFRRLNCLRSSLLRHSDKVYRFRWSRWPPVRSAYSSDRTPLWRVGWWSHTLCSRARLKTQSSENFLSVIRFSQIQAAPELRCC